MKVVAIILLILQGLSIFGSISNGSFSDTIMRGFTGGVSGFCYLLGFFLPTIIALILFSRAGKKKVKKQAVQVPVDPNGWTCGSCKSPNMADSKHCWNCGAARNPVAATAPRKPVTAAAPRNPVEPVIPQRPVAAEPPKRSVTVAVPTTGELPKTTASTYSYVPRRRAILYVCTGPQAGREFVCREGETLFIGRDPDRCNMLMTGYETVSRVHCCIGVSRDGVSLVDMGSSNGTYMGGARLVPHQPVSVENGAEILLATQECILRIRIE